MLFFFFSFHLVILGFHHVMTHAIVILSFFAEFKRRFILYHLFFFFPPLNQNQKSQGFHHILHVYFISHKLPSSTTMLNKLKDITIKRCNHLPCHWLMSINKSWRCRKSSVWGAGESGRELHSCYFLTTHVWE